MGQSVRCIAPFGGAHPDRLARQHANAMRPTGRVCPVGGLQQVRVFSLRGAHLLGMLARTEKAKEFRRWVLDVIESHNDEMGILTTQYHKALIAYTTGKASASMCGKGF